MNPSNLCIFKGTVNSPPKEFCNEGVCFAIEFQLKVERNYLNKGIQKYDYPIIRYSKPDVKEVCKSLKNGMYASVMGAYYSGFIVVNNTTIKKQVILADSIELYSSSSYEDEQLELPY